MNKQKRINWIKDRISSMEQCRDEMPFGLSEDESMELSAYKDSFASLTAEPEYYVFKHPNGKLFHSLVDESCKGHDDVYPVYADPPVPEIKFPPEFNESHDSFNEFRRGWNGAISEVKRINGFGE